MVSFIGKYHSNEKVFYQPNVMRLRAPLRSPMNSERLNLEAGQFRYDIFNLYQQNDSAQTKLDSNLSMINDGDSSVYQITKANVATPTAITIKSLASLAAKFDTLNRRMEILEKGLG